MNILLINHYAGSLDHGMEFRPYYLAREWTKKGHKVIIVAASFSHLRSRQPSVVTKFKKDTIDGIEYVWLRTNTYVGNGIGRMLSMFLFSFRVWFLRREYLTDFVPDLVIASSTYPLDNIPAYWLSRTYKALLCYEVHDLWPLSPMELGGYSKYHPFVLVMQWAENFAYKKVDLVVSLLPKTLDHMVEHGLKPEKFIYIPNGIAVEEWQLTEIPHEHEALLQNLHGQHKIIVGYVGGHALSNALETLIGVAEIALHGNPELTFVLVGSGIEKKKLIDKAKTLNLTNVHFLPSVSKKSVPRLLSMMDVLYLGWQNNPLYRFGISPNKLMDYMMSAKPVVHSVKAGNDIVKESGCGISVDPGDQQAVADALKAIAAMSLDAREKMGDCGKDFIMKNNRYEILAQKFIDFVETKKN